MSGEALTWAKSHKAATIGGAAVVVVIGYVLMRRRAAGKAGTTTSSDAGPLTDASGGQYLVPYMGSGITAADNTGTTGVAGNTTTGTTAAVVNNNSWLANAVAYLAQQPGYTALGAQRALMMYLNGQQLNFAQGVEVSAAVKQLGVPPAPVALPNVNLATPGGPYYKPPTPGVVVSPNRAKAVTGTPPIGPKHAVFPIVSSRAGTITALHAA